jgi:hypothetical protein
MRNHPITNGLAVHGTIRLYKADKPVLATLFGLFFIIGPIGFLFWSILLFTLLKPVALFLGIVVGFFAVGMYVGSTHENSALGWFAGFVYLLILGIGYLISTHLV